MINRKEYKILKKCVSKFEVLRMSKEISNDYVIGVRGADLSEKEKKNLKRLIIVSKDNTCFTYGVNENEDYFILPKDVGTWIYSYKDNLFKKYVSFFALILSSISLIVSLFF